jgi:hypothetical protein
MRYSMTDPNIKGGCDSEVRIIPNQFAVEHQPRALYQSYCFRTGTIVDYDQAAYLWTNGCNIVE